MNLKALLWFVYKLKFHVIAALAFNGRKTYRGALRRWVRSPKPRGTDRSAVARHGRRAEAPRGGGQKPGSPDLTDFPDAVPGEPRLTHGLSPSELRAKVKSLETVPSCGGRPCARAPLRRPLSFVLRPSLSPSGGQGGVRYPPHLRDGPGRQTRTGSRSPRGPREDANRHRRSRERKKKKKKMSSSRMATFPRGRPDVSPGSGR